MHKTAKPCPLCYGSGLLPEPTIDLNTNTITYCDNRLSVPPREAEIFFAILKEQPISTDKLISMIYGLTEPEKARNGINVFVHRLNIRLSQLGLHIKSIRLLMRRKPALYVITKEKE